MAHPMFFTADDRHLAIEGMFKNQSCFLILSGPSLNLHDLTLLNAPGIITMGVNNSPKAFRPNLWCCVDCQSNFMISIWKDPRIIKFVPFAKSEKHLFDNTTWSDSHLAVDDCPAVVYYRRNEKFNPETYLIEDTVNWGCHKDNGGGRSVFLATMRIINILGFSKVFLLGCDFKMDEEHKYAFPQDRAPGSQRGNNSSYRKMNERFTALRPFFEQKNFFVWNCYKESGLTAFDYMPFTEAVKIATKDMPDVKTERSEGMYERQALARQEERDSRSGVIYYNDGQSCLVRLATSLNSLRRQYQGKVTIISEQNSIDTCTKIAKHFNVDVKQVSFPHHDKSNALLNKCKMHEVTPYDLTVFLDADTLIVKDFNKMFKTADDEEFITCQFADWTPKTKFVRDRIDDWKLIAPADVACAMEYGHALNTGVFAFKKKSAFMKDWYSLAIKGKDFFIPDEIACQIFLYKYKHKIFDTHYNESCKYSRITRRTKIIHFHGRKHCRIGDNGKYLFHSDLWYNEFDKIRELDFVKENIRYDRQLSIYLPIRDGKQPSIEHDRGEKQSDVGVPDMQKELQVCN